MGGRASDGGGTGGEDDAARQRLDAYREVTGDGGARSSSSHVAVPRHAAPISASAHRSSTPTPFRPIPFSATIPFRPHACVCITAVLVMTM